MGELGSTRCTPRDQRTLWAVCEGETTVGVRCEAPETSMMRGGEAEDGDATLDEFGEFWLRPVLVEMVLVERASDEPGEVGEESHNFEFVYSGLRMTVPFSLGALACEYVDSRKFHDGAVVGGRPDRIVNDFSEDRRGKPEYPCSAFEAEASRTLRRAYRSQSAIARRMTTTITTEATAMAMIAPWDNPLFLVISSIEVALVLGLAEAVMFAELVALVVDVEVDCKEMQVPLLCELPPTVKRPVAVSCPLPSLMTKASFVPWRASMV